MEAKRPPKPLIVTSLCKLNTKSCLNQISITWTPSDSLHTVSIYLGNCEIKKYFDLFYQFSVFICGLFHKIDWWIDFHVSWLYLTYWLILTSVGCIYVINKLFFQNNFVCIGWLVGFDCFIDWLIDWYGYLVEKLSPSDLLVFLKARGQRDPEITKALIRSKLEDKDSDEIATTSCKVRKTGLDVFRIPEGEGVRSLPPPFLDAFILKFVNLFSITRW